MSTNPRKPASPSTAVLKNSAAAPIVYFDNVPVYGASAGNIQVEVAARMLAPSSTAESGVAVDLICTAHLRCTPQSALVLIDALQKGLEMLAKQAEQPSTLLDS